MASERSYISVLGWPDWIGEEQAIGALVGSMGLDPYNAGLIVRARGAGVIGSMEPPLARDAAARLRIDGVPATAIEQDAIEAMRPAVLAKRLTPFPTGDGRFAADLWRGGRVTVSFGRASLIVRALVEQTSRSVEMQSEVAYTPDGAVTYTSATPQKKVKTTEFIEVHDPAGGRLRIDSRRFDFEPLGYSNLWSHRERCDRLALDLAAGAPAALLDDGFREWRCPTHILQGIAGRLAHADKGVRSDRVFDFYSAWLNLMHRAEREAAEKRAGS